MNIEEAKIALQKGSRVSHPLLPKRVWIEQTGDEYWFEDGQDSVIITVELFWKYRDTKSDWENGWFIIEK